MYASTLLFCPVPGRSLFSLLQFFCLIFLVIVVLLSFFSLFLFCWSFFTMTQRSNKHHTSFLRLTIPAQSHHRSTGSWNYRMLWIGKDLQDHLIPNIFHYTRLLRVTSNMALDNFRDGTSTISLVPHHPHNKEFFPNI